MKKTLIAAAALSIVVAPISVATAHAAPPTYCGLSPNQMTPEQYTVCSGGYTKPPPVGSTGYADCDQYQIISDRNTCVNNHIAAGVFPN
jgi:hypothetical protein